MSIDVKPKGKNPITHNQDWIQTQESLNKTWPNNYLDHKTKVTKIKCHKEVIFDKFW
jgi:hypothetical protein